MLWDKVSIAQVFGLEINPPATASHVLRLWVYTTTTSSNAL